MNSYRVAEIWRYPVKSMQGEKLDTCMLTKGGIPLAQRAADILKVQRATRSRYPYSGNEHR